MTPFGVPAGTPDELDSAAPDRPATGARRWRFGRVLRGIIFGIGILASLAGALGVGLWITTPPVDDLLDRVAAMASERHVSMLGPADVPAGLAAAVVAIEDERFYQHHGVDTLGLGRAILYDVGHLCGCQGGSTITEQLAKQVYLDGTDAGLNKLRDMVLALKVEQSYGKAEILAAYLSVIATGYGRTGMAAASCADFGRPLAALNLGQDALLAGLPQAPSAYDPLLHPAAARARQRAVLAAMVEGRLISAAEASAAQADTGPFTRVALDPAVVPTSTRC